MTDYTRNTLTGSLAPVNNELEKIEVSLRQKLDRNPSIGQNNEMLVDLDMNGNRIINYTGSVLDEDLVTRGEVPALAPVQSVDGNTGNVVSPVQSVNGQTGNVSIPTEILVDSTVVFDNISEMKSSSLAVGLLAKCKRYYAGGDLVDGLVYEIQATQSVDSYVNHALANGNIAKLITSTLNVKQAGLVGDGVTNDTVALRAAINSLRRNEKDILDSIGGTIITVYESGELLFPEGVYLIDAEFLINQDIGLQFTGVGGRGKTNYSNGKTTILINGAGAYGISAELNGSRNFVMKNLSLCYKDATFTGDLLRNTGCQGMQVKNCFLGTYGIVAIERLRTAKSLLRITYDEFLHVENTVFDGAEYGVYDDGAISLYGNTFGGSNTTIQNCVFYDFTKDQIFSTNNRTRQAFYIGRNYLNPITEQPERCLNLSNAEGVVIEANGFLGSTTEAPSIEWLNLFAVTGTLHSNNFGTFSDAGTLNGQISLSCNKLGSDTGFLLTGGNISSSNNEFIAGTYGYKTTPVSALIIDLSNDTFKAGVTTSYNIDPSSASLFGKISYAKELDSSTNKFVCNDPNVTVENLDNGFFTVSATTYSVNKQDTGKTHYITGTSAVITLPLGVGSQGTTYRFVQGAGQEFSIRSGVANNIVRGGDTSARTQINADASQVGALVELKCNGNLWFVTQQIGNWTTV